MQKFVNSIINSHLMVAYFKGTTFSEDVRQKYKKLILRSNYLNKARTTLLCNALNLK